MIQIVQLTEEQFFHDIKLSLGAHDSRESALALLDRMILADDEVSA